MKLWTIQPISMLEKIQRKEVIIPDNSIILEGKFLKDSPDIETAYRWMKTSMNKRLSGNHQDTFPFWGWYKYDNQTNNELIDISEWSGYEDERGYCILINLEIPDNQVLLSDFDLWHSVLNDDFCNTEITEKEWELKEQWFDDLDTSEKESVKYQSWDSIFCGTTHFKNKFCEVGRYIQATFYEIRPEYVTSFKILKL